MTRDQILTLAILAGMIVLFLSNRLRYDMVALLGLVAAVLAGVVPADKAFSGFANPVLPLIAGALVVSAAIGAIGGGRDPAALAEPVLRSKELQVGVLVGCVAVLVGFDEECRRPGDFHAGRGAGGAAQQPLAVGIPDAARLRLVARRLDDADRHLAQHARFRACGRNSVGEPFQMFDFTPVGAGIALFGVLFLTFGWRLIPQRRRSRPAELAFTVEDYTSELRVGKGSAYIGRTVGEVEELSGGAVSIIAVIRETAGG